MDLTGSSDEEELHDKLRHVMLRLLKCNVLSELPPKQRSIVPIQITDREVRKKCLETMQELHNTRMSLSELVCQDVQQADFEAKAKLMQAYQQTGFGKAQAIADYLTDCWVPGSSPSQKILIFGHHKGVLDTTDQALMQKFLKSFLHSPPFALQLPIPSEILCCNNDPKSHLR